MMTSRDLRKLFFNYFEEADHVIVPSSSLVPDREDKSLLFVNAGMVPFKPIFSGSALPAAKNVASIQRCLRAGGKHNDLENVGYTARHHTFFEMLGNFSFGGYFKKQAICSAFSFLTNILKIPSDRLWVTVYQEDRETADIWLNDLGFDPNRFSYCGKADNFWMMGDTGPCGPCTEIFYDYGPGVAGSPPGSKEAAGDRYVEIWNLVFMQYNCQTDGQLVGLPKPCIDTGMGLERLAAVMQGVVSNYETDLFKPLIQTTAQLVPATLMKESSLKIIADHIRAIGFLILDGIFPSNEARGYVLRRIIRRALRYTYQANVKQPCLYQLIPTFVSQMEEDYPALKLAEQTIIQVLYKEEKQFLRTLAYGLQYFEKVVTKLPGNSLPGSLVFKLYDTYGFPVDLTAELAREQNLSWDEQAFEVEMTRQKARSKAAQLFMSTPLVDSVPSLFKGYTQLEHRSSLVGLLDEAKQPIEELVSGQKGYVILDETPFYAEAGGQVGDQGELWNQEGCSSTINRFIVLDTQQINNTYLHRGYLKEGRLGLKTFVHSQVNHKRRQAIKRHHSATHLLHAVLRELFGSEVSQKGSLVAPGSLRFDFQYSASLRPEDIRHIEYRVNQVIWDNLAVETRLMSLKEAKEIGAMALFDQKYSETVRVLCIGNFSIELCGGTHVDHTGEIGYFKIISSGSIAAGIKRIEAVVGESAFEFICKMEQRQNALASLLKTNSEKMLEQVERQLVLLKQQTKRTEDLEHYLCQQLVRTLSKEAQPIGEMTVVLKMVPGLASRQLRQIIDRLKSYLLPASVVVLGGQLPEGEGLFMGIGISKQSVQKVNAEAIVRVVRPVIEGKGGGRPDFAQVYSKSGDASKIYLALEAVRSYLEEIASH